MCIFVLCFFCLLSLSIFAATATGAPDPAAAPNHQPPTRPQRRGSCRGGRQCCKKKQNGNRIENGKRKRRASRMEMTFVSFSLSHGGADFRSHTAAQIFAPTRRRRFSPPHGGADFRSHTAAQIFALVSFSFPSVFVSVSFPFSSFRFRFRFRFVFAGQSGAM